MANTVIKNTDSKLLRNSAGKVLKQNYAFDYAFARALTTAIYCSCPRLDGVSLGNAATMVFWLKCTGTVTGVSPQRVLFRYNDDVFIKVGMGGGFFCVCTSITFADGGTTAGNYDVLQSTPISANKQMYALEFKNNLTKPTPYVNGAPGSWVYGMTSRNYTPPLICSNPSIFPSGSFATAANILTVDEVMLFSRPFITGELAYLYALGAGNEPPTFEGLELYVKCNEAESLDVSIAQDGSNMQPALRDYSGKNRHCNINGLPAGTVAEKVNYYNTYYRGTL